MTADILTAARHLWPVFAVIACLVILAAALVWADEKVLAEVDAALGSLEEER